MNHNNQCSRCPGCVEAIAADRARVMRLTEALSGARRLLRDAANAMATCSRDWSSDYRDAWLWGVVVGWDDASLRELSSKLGWSARTVDKLLECRQAHAALKGAK